MSDEQAVPERRSGDGWAKVAAGNFSELKKFRYQHPSGTKARGKVFLGELLGAKGLEVSMNSFPAGAAMPFLHAHKENEEVYLFLSGRGEMVVGSEIIPVEEGSAVRVEPRLPRAWRNTGEGPIAFLCIQYRADSVIPLEIADGVYLGPVSWNLNDAKEIPHG